MRRWLLIGGSGLAVVIAGGWLGWPLLRQWQVDRNLRLAREYLGQDDLRNGWLCLRQALQLNPNSLPATRLMGDLLEQANNTDAVVWRRRLATLAPTVENRLALAAAGLRWGKPPFPEAQQAMAGLQSEGATNRVDYHLLAAQLATRMGLTRAAIGHLREASRLDPSNRLPQVNLAILELGQTNAALARKAREKLRELAGNTSVALPALRALAQDSLARNAWDEALEWCQRLAAHPAAAFTDRLAQLRLLAVRKDERLSRTIDQLTESAATNAVQAAALLDALVRLHLAVEATHCANRWPTNLTTSPAVSIAIAEALRQQAAWARLQRHLETARWDRLEWLRWAERSRLQRQLALPYAAKGSWRQALQAATGDRAALTALARLTREWAWSEEYEEVLQTTVQRFPGERWAFLDLESLLAKSGRTRQLNQLYEQMSQANPTNLVLRNNLALTSLLLGHATNRAFRLAREVWLTDTNNLSFASTQAFALLLQNRSEEGLELLRGFPTNQLQRPSLAPYLIALLRATGRAEEARHYAAFVPPAGLLPEERALALGRPLPPRTPVNKDLGDPARTRRKKASPPEPNSAAGEPPGYQASAAALPEIPPPQVQSSLAW